MLSFYSRPCCHPSRPPPSIAEAGKRLYFFQFKFRSPPNIICKEQTITTEASHSRRLSIIYIFTSSDKHVGNLTKIIKFQPYYSQFSTLVPLDLDEDGGYGYASDVRSARRRFASAERRRSLLFPLLKSCRRIATSRFAAL